MSKNKWEVILLSIINEVIQYEPFGKCVKLSNGVIELIFTLDVGPRAISYKFVGKENVFNEDNGALVPYDDVSSWKIKGGHRLWHTPEKYPRNYVPDDGPIEWEEVPGGIKVIQPLEAWTNIRKEMLVTIDDATSRVTVVHTLINKGAWPINIGVWAMSVMAPGGTLVVPQSRKDTGVEMNRVLALWPYSDMRDDRVYWGKDYVFLKQDEQADIPFKFGLNHEDTWAAYINKGTLFMKSYDLVEGGTYPDNGCSFEAYTCDKFLEVETLSPLLMMAPNDSASHVERWVLVEGVEVPETEQLVAELKSLI